MHFEFMDYGKLFQIFFEAGTSKAQSFSTTKPRLPHELPGIADCGRTSAPTTGDTGGSGKSSDLQWNQLWKFVPYLPGKK